MENFVYEGDSQEPETQEENLRSVYVIEEGGNIRKFVLDNENFTKLIQCKTKRTVDYILFELKGIEVDNVNFLQ